MMTIEELHEMFFGPLDKSYCNLFLVFSMIALLALFLSVVSIILQLLTFKKKAFNPLMWTYALLGPLIVYFQNRLLYGMCKN
jgi:hypothetical protein